MRVGSRALILVDLSQAGRNDLGDDQTDGRCGKIFQDGGCDLLVRVVQGFGQVVVDGMIVALDQVFVQGVGVVVGIQICGVGPVDGDVDRTDRRSPRGRDGRARADGGDGDIRVLLGGGLGRGRRQGRQNEDNDDDERHHEKGLHKTLQTLHGVLLLRYTVFSTASIISIAYL